jgi:hypothetical protein
MKTLFSNKRSMSLIRGGITLLTLSILISIFAISPLATTQAQRSWKSLTQPNLGTAKTAFSDFCYSYWASGQHLPGLRCLRQSTKATHLLQHELSADNFQLWPATYSLSDLAAKGLLTNPQTGQPIKTQQDFVAAISVTYRGLLDLFNGNRRILSVLWTYRLTVSNTPPPPPSPVSASDVSPSCPVDPQSFGGSDLWPALGPSFLTTTSNSFQDQSGGHAGIYDIYGRLLLQDKCSIGAFALTMAQVNGQTPTPDRIADWERDTLSAAAYTEALANAPSVKALICLLAQPNNGLIDNWFSAAIITHPISSLTTSTAPTTSGATPSSQSVSVSHVQVN